jgi:hypothetical protein
MNFFKIDNNDTTRRRFVKELAVGAGGLTFMSSLRTALEPAGGDLIAAPSVVVQNTQSPSKPKPNRKQKKLLFMSDSPTGYERLTESIKAIPGSDLLVSRITVNYQRPQEIIQSISGQDADILLMCLSRFTFSFGSLYDSMGDLNIPIIILSSNPGLILIDSNLVASLRANGANVTFTLSETEALEALKIASSPRILEDKQALLYGKPFDSTSVPSRNLSEDLVYKRTGVRIRFRPIDELAALYKGVDAASALREMERWKKEAVEVIRVPDQAILEISKLYVLLRSIIEKEGLSAIGIDCLSFTMSPNPPLPHPCLAFARLRDDGITAACEADVCGMISSMFLQEISRRPSFMANVMSVNVPKSYVVLSHCVAPLKLNGSNAAPMKYRLHDYHSLGRGVVPEVEFPQGMEVTIGEFSKDLKSFSLWPGRIQLQAKDTDRSSFSGGLTGNVCANTLDVKIRNAGRFLQNIAGTHHIMIAGNYAKEIEVALFGMKVNLVGPSDFTAPEL